MKAAAIDEHYTWLNTISILQFLSYSLVMNRDKYLLLNLPSIGLLNFLERKNLNMKKGYFNTYWGVDVVDRTPASQLEALISIFSSSHAK